MGELDWNVNDGTNRIDGLIAHYKMNDNAANTTVVDSVGGYTGTSVRNTSLISTTGKINNDFNFNGTSDYISLPFGFTNGNGNTVYSFSAWIKTSSNGRIVSSCAGSFTQSAGIVSAASVTDNLWHHVVAIRDGATLYLYLDGSLAGTVATNSGYSGVILQVDAGKVDWRSFNVNALSTSLIGLFQNDTQLLFNGLIDDVRVYQKALSAIDVNAIYNSGNGTEQNGRGDWTDNNLVAYYKFDSKNGTTVFDSARGNTGTLTNGADTNARGLWDTNALYLDGVNDLVSIPNSSSLAFTNAFSVSGWVNTTKTANTNYDGIFSGVYAGSGKVYFYLGMGSPGGPNHKLSAGFYSPGWHYVDSPINLPAAKWVHAAATYDGQYIKIYQDGILVATSSDFALNLPANSDGWLVGRGWDASYWQGAIDEIKVYKKVLTASEVQADYNRGLFDSNYVSRIVDTNSGYGVTDFNYLVLNSNNGLDKNGYNYGTQIEPTIEKDLNFGLMGLYHLNGDVADSSVYARTGAQCTNPSVSVAGLWGTQAYYFNGTNTCLRTGYNTMDPNGAISFWFKSPVVLNSASSSQTLFDKVASSNDFAVFHNLASDGTIGFRNQRSGTQYNAYTKTNVFDSNRWYHVVVTWGSLGTKIYLNGVLEGINSFTGIPSGNTGYYYLASYTNGSGPYFNGSMEDFAIWNRALDANSVKELFNKGASRIGAKYRGCSDSTCSTNPAWSSLTYPDSNSRINLDAIDGSQYLQYALYPTLYTFPDGNIFPQAFASIRDVNVVYVN
jgi:hypothetical protein